MRHSTTLGTLALATATLATSALAQGAPADVADLVGARGAGGETQLEARGYVHVSTETGSDRKWSRWWNPQREQCVTVTTMDGRYSAITLAPSSDCDRGGETDAGAPGWAETGSEAINLICYGGGDRPGTRVSSGYEWDSRDKKYRRVVRTEQGRLDFNAEVTLQFYGDEGRIRPTGRLVPPIHSGDDSGWWTLDDVRITRDKITARYRLNGLNKPKVAIDRRSGRITIDGIEDFRGTCDSIDDNTRRF